MTYYTTQDRDDFLRESNAIEGEYSREALEDAMGAWYIIHDKEILTLETIKEVHRILLSRLNPGIAGQWGKWDVTVGGRIINRVSDEYTEGRLQWFIDLIDKGVPKKMSPEEFTKNCHIVFENIHPFDDGNGRVGRILYNWHRLKLDLPLHIIHEGEEQMSYYKWFK